MRSLCSRVPLVKLTLRVFLSIFDLSVPFSGSNDNLNLFDFR